MILEVFGSRFKRSQKSKLKSKKEEQLCSLRILHL